MAKTNRSSKWEASEYSAPQYMLPLPGNVNSMPLTHVDPPFSVIIRTPRRKLTLVQDTVACLCGRKFFKTRRVSWTSFIWSQLIFALLKLVTTPGVSPHNSRRPGRKNKAQGRGTLEPESRFSSVEKHLSQTSLSSLIKDRSLTTVLLFECLSLPR